MRGRVTQPQSGRMASERELWHPGAMLPRHPLPFPVCLHLTPLGVLCGAGDLQMSTRLSLSSARWRSSGCKDAQAKMQEVVRAQDAAAALCHVEGLRAQPWSSLPGFERGGYLELIFPQVLSLVLQLDGTKLIVGSVCESSEIIFKSIKKNKVTIFFSRNKGRLYYFFLKPPLRIFFTLL